ncbi:MAG TPA: hypothetical protein VEH77_08135 [Roseiarcus sp.]|nr:hypothetical protein [Roseiarcus sp.]
MNEDARPTGDGAAPATNATLPTFEACLAAVSVKDETGKDVMGLAALGRVATALQSRCPQLASTLLSSSVKASLESYGRQDGEAQRQEDKLKSEAFWSNASLLAAGVMSGLILAVSAGALQVVGAVDPTTQSRIVLILGLLTLFLGACAAYFAYIARDQSRVARWQTCRSEAETARLSAFSTISTKSVVDAAGAPAVAVYGLAVVVRHLLNDQGAYLARSVQRHRARSETTSRMGALGSALAFVGGSGAIIASQTTADAAPWIVWLGVVGAAIGAFAANRESVSRDRANAERYDKTLVAMDAVAGRTDDVAAATGRDPKALDAFTKTIVDLLSAENQQWLDGTAQANAALDALDGRLQQIGKGKTAA